MKCPYCKGSGKYFIENKESNFTVVGRVYREIACPKCMGTGEIKQTNEEWFCLLSTEQKAEALAKREAPQTNITEVKAVLKEKWLEWLKAVHKE